MKHTTGGLLKDSIVQALSEESGLCRLQYNVTAKIHTAASSVTKVADQIF